MLDTTTSQPTNVHRGAVRILATGAGAGLAWGISMRAWMRFISTSPEFSWSGTLFILGASVIAGTVLAYAWHRRRVGGAGFWRLSFASLLLLGAGGAVMWPSVTLGAIAFGLRRPTWLRLLLALGAVAAQIPVIGGIADNWRFGPGEIALATVWYAPMLAFEAWAFSVAFAPSVDGARTPGRVRNILIVVMVGAVGLIAVLALGLGDM